MIIITQEGEGGNSNNEEVNTTNENILHVPSNRIIPAKGCPVICHGLVNASYLYGQIGEVRDFSQKCENNTDNNTSSTQHSSGNSCNDGIRLVVYFEKRGMRNALVKPENLRIVFDLDEEEVKKKKESK
jgi:hypothetical protein